MIVSIETILSVLVALVTIGTFAYALPKLWRERLHVRRFAADTDKYFEEALDLYDQNFDDWEKDEPEEIVRWLEEARARPTGNDRPLEEYLLCAIWKQRPCGFFYGTFYKSKSALFVSYLVVDHPEGQVASRIPKKLMAAVGKHLKKDGYECTKIVAEVEVPAAAPTIKIKKKRKARIRRLMQISMKSDVPLGVLDVAYTQPKLDLNDADKREDQLLLLYGSVCSETPPALSREEVADLLRFVYDKLYGDCFMEDPDEDEKWRRYTANLRDLAISNLPENIRWLTKYDEIFRVR